MRRQGRSVAAAAARGAAALRWGVGGVRGAAAACRCRRRYFVASLGAVLLLARPALRPAPLGFAAARPAGGAPGRLAVVLDVDECLVHSTNWSRTAGGAVDSFRQAEAVRPDQADDGRVDSFRLSVNSGSDQFSCTVLKRAGLDEFLRQCAELFDVFTFTAGTQPYAEPLLDMLDPEHRLIKGRFYRTECREVQVVGRGYQYLKDLAAVTGDMRRVVLVDNNPMSFVCQPRNGIPIADFIGGEPDGELARVLALLRRLDAEEDVRPVLDGMFALEGKLASLRREFLGEPAPGTGAGLAPAVD